MSEKNYYQKNKDKVLSYSKEYGQKHKDKIKKYNHDYYIKNKEKLVARHKEYQIKIKQRIQNYNPLIEIKKVDKPFKVKKIELPKRFSGGSLDEKITKIKKCKIPVYKFKNKINPVDKSNKVLSFD